MSDLYKDAQIFRSKRVEARTPCGTMFVIGNYDYDNPDNLIQTHLFINKSYIRTPCLKCLLEGISRLASLAMKEGVSIWKIINELDGMRCNYEKGDLKYNVNISCLNAYANALRRLRKWNGGKVDEE